MKTRFISKVLLYWFCISFLFSCKDQKIEPQKCLLTAIKDERGRVLERFEYNTSGQLVEHQHTDFSQQITRNIEYNSAGLINRVVESYPNFDSLWVYSFEYLNNGRQIIEHKQCKLDNVSSKYILQLNLESQLVQYTLEDLQYIRYEYSKAGDLEKVFFKDFEGSPNSEEYLVTQYEDFDKNPSPFADSKSLRMYLQLILRRQVSLHNARKMQYWIYYNLSNEIVISHGNLSYVYNSHNYPIQATGLTGACSSLTYEYNCP